MLALGVILMIIGIQIYFIMQSYSFQCSGYNISISIIFSDMIERVKGCEHASMIQMSSVVLFFIGIGFTVAGIKSRFNSTLNKENIVKNG